MKKVTHLFLCFVLMLFAINKSQAQVDISSMGFNYSALVRDTAGRVQPSKQVQLRFTVLSGQNSSQSSINNPWSETQNITTDTYGFANTTIGTGTKVGGTASTFSAVDFSTGNYWVLIEVYNSFTKAFDPLAKQALQAVPFAKVAYQSIYGGVPAGTIVAWAGPTTNIPTGWELCDGHAVVASDPKYVNLFKAIGYAWGKDPFGIGFNIPQTKGMFLRGQVVDLTGNDPDVAQRKPIQIGGNAGNNVGSFQDDAFAQHQHNVNYTNHNFMDNDECLHSTSGGSNVCYGRQTLNISVGDSPTGGKETRPKNVYVNYIIKL